MDYTDGSHIITARKSFNCEFCQQTIQPKEVYFARVKVIVPDREKEYKRYHLACAYQLPDLTNEDHQKILNEIAANASKSTLNDTILKELNKYEYQGYLVAIPYNIQSTKNFIVSLKNGMAIILSLTSSDNKSMPPWLKTKFDFMKKLSNNVYTISSIEDFGNIMNRYNNLERR